jgi:hypothetical protein
MYLTFASTTWGQPRKGEANRGVNTEMVLMQTYQAGHGKATFLTKQNSLLTYPFSWQRLSSHQVYWLPLPMRTKPSKKPVDTVVWQMSGQCVYASVCVLVSLCVWPCIFVCVCLLVSLCACVFVCVCALMCMYPIKLKGRCWRGQTWQVQHCAAAVYIYMHCCCCCCCVILYIYVCVRMLDMLK